MAKNLNGQPVFCERCPNKGDCAGALSSTYGQTYPTESKKGYVRFYDTAGKGSEPIEYDVPVIDATTETANKPHGYDTAAYLWAKVGAACLDYVRNCPGPSADGQCGALNENAVSLIIEDTLSSMGS